MKCVQNATDLAVLLSSDKKKRDTLVRIYALLVECNHNWVKTNLSTDTSKGDYYEILYNNRAGLSLIYADDFFNTAYSMISLSGDWANYEVNVSDVKASKDTFIKSKLVYSDGNLYTANTIMGVVEKLYNKLHEDVVRRLYNDKALEKARELEEKRKAEEAQEQASEEEQASGEDIDLLAGLKETSGDEPNDWEIIDEPGGEDIDDPEDEELTPEEIEELERERQEAIEAEEEAKRLEIAKQAEEQANKEVEEARNRENERIAKEKAAAEKEEREKKEILTDEVKKSDEEFYKAMRGTWGGNLNTVLDGIMETYESLYESCYDVSIPGGILLDKGMIKVNSEGRIVNNGDVVTSARLHTYINEILPKHGFRSYLSNNDSAIAPDIKQLASVGVPVVLYPMHLQFMYGNFRYCKGLAKYLKTDGKAGKGYNTVRVLSWGKIKPWVRHKLEEYFFDAYKDYGVQYDIQDFQVELKKVDTVNEILSRSLKNVIVVSDYKAGQNTELRISSDTPINPEEVAGQLSARLNIGTSSNTEVQVVSYEKGVLDINIIYNKKRYADASLFAHEVLDSLMDQGIRPSWSNVIMGKSLDGKTYKHYFKGDTNPIYCLYAGSRSGKGVMTLNLLASALADGCKVLYTDAKPEMAHVLAQIAWKAGKECYAINGLDKAGHMEDREGCPRKEISFRGLDDIPSYLFNIKGQKDPTTGSEATGENRVSKREFYRLMQYYRSLEVFVMLMESRVGKDTNDWVVSVFDELQQLEAVERVILNNFKTIESNIAAKKKELKKGDPLPKEMEDALAYIKQFRAWSDAIMSKWQSGIGSVFGKARCTILFVWQSSLFPINEKDTKSLLSKIVSSCAGKAIKIVGRGGIVAGGMSAFGNGTACGDWYKKDERFTGLKGGYFAITPNVSEATAKVFRPYNIYSDANGKNKIIENAAANGVKPEDLLGSALYRDEEGEYQVIPEVGFEGYLNKFLGYFNLDPATQISAGFDYADAFVRGLSGGKLGLLDYFYSSKMSLSVLEIPEDDEETGESVERVGVTNQSPDFRDFTPSGDEEPVRGTSEASGNGVGASGKEITNGFEKGGRFGLDDEPAIVLHRDGTVSRGEGGRKVTGQGAGQVNGGASAGDIWDTDVGEFNPGKAGGEHLGGYEEPSRGRPLGGYEEPSGGYENIDDPYEPEGGAEDALTKSLQALQDSVNKADEIDADENKDTVEKYKALRKSQMEQMETVKQMSDIIQVLLTNNQAAPSYERVNGQAVYNKVDDSFADECSFSNSMKTTFNLGKQSITRKMASWRGVDLETRQTFLEIIQCIERSGFDVRKATRLRIEENVFAVNGKKIDLKEFTGGQGSLYNMIDLVDFDILYKKFKGVQYMYLDITAFDKLFLAERKRRARDYNDALNNLFKNMKSLMELTYTDYNGNVQSISRTGVLNGKAEEEIQKVQQNGMTINKLTLASMNKIGKEVNGDKSKTSKANRAWDTTKAVWGEVPAGVKKFGGTVGLTAGVLGIGSLLFVPIFGQVLAAGTFISGVYNMGKMTEDNNGSTGGGRKLLENKKGKGENL